MVCVLRLAANCFGRAYICRQACLLVVCTEERGEGRGGRRRGRERGRGRGKGRWRGRGRGRGRGRERGRGRGRERGRGRGRGKSTCGTLQFISYTRERRTLNTFWMFMECDAELKHTHTHTHTHTHWTAARPKDPPRPPSQCPNAHAFYGHRLVSGWHPAPALCLEASSGVCPSPASAASAPHSTAQGCRALAAILLDTCAMLLQMLDLYSSTPGPRADSAGPTQSRNGV
jgi:hypothetical protein